MRRDRHLKTWAVDSKYEQIAVSKVLESKRHCIVYPLFLKWLKTAWFKKYGNKVIEEAMNKEKYGTKGIKDSVI